MFVNIQKAFRKILKSFILQRYVFQGCCIKYKKPNILYISHILQVIIDWYRRLDSDRDAIRKKVYPLEQMDLRNTAHIYELRFLKNQC